MRILLTGGAGYIGSHTAVELYNAGHEVVIVDNLANSKEEAIKRVEKITGKEVPFVKADVRDREAMDKIRERLLSDPRWTKYSRVGRLMQ